MTRYLKWREDWINATEWETLNDPDDPRECQHPPPLTTEDEFVRDFYRWNCRNRTAIDFGMIPPLVAKLGIRGRASLEIFMIKLDMIRESEARIAERNKTESDPGAEGGE